MTMLKNTEVKLFTRSGHSYQRQAYKNHQKVKYVYSMSLENQEFVKG
jgi:hypothetical protein